MGKIIVIDGMDGCGKATQTAIIKNILEEKGYNVKTIAFPKYESLSSGPVRMYLNGEISSNPSDINPYAASMFYAVDRIIQYKTDFEKYCNDENTIILLDRYLSSNIIYQSSKLDTDDKKREFFKWVYELETKYGGIPVEDVTIALTLPIETSQRLMSNRYDGDESKKDIHEANVEFLKKCKGTIDLACEYLPTIGYNWVHLDCSDEDGNIRSKDDITNDIISILRTIITI